MFTFASEVKSLLEECRVSLKRAILEKTAAMLVRDLAAAVSALEIIERELREGDGRPIGSRSRQFIRYVVDEGEQMSMDSILRDRIVGIEDRSRKLET